MNKVLTYITIFLVIVIAVVALFDIDEAVKIAVNAIVAAILIGMLVKIGDIFKSNKG
jgi:uncharacterized membrane protein YadS